MQLNHVWLQNNGFTKLPTQAPLRHPFLTENNSITVISSEFCCGVNRMKIEGNAGSCNVSCAQHGNPWSVAGCRDNEHAFIFPLRKAQTVPAGLCAATYCECSGDLPQWNPSGVEHCVLTRRGAKRCSVLCLDDRHCGHPRSVCVFGLLDASVKDQSGKPLGVCAYL